MLRYALISVRGRAAGFVAAFVTLTCAAAIVTACGLLLQTGLRGTIATERFAGTPVVVAGDQFVHQTTVKHTHGKTKFKRKSKALAERVWLPAGTAERVSRISGVRRAVGDVTFPVDVVRGGRLVHEVDGSPLSGHGWSSAKLAPFHLLPGGAPPRDGEVVVDLDLASRLDLHRGSTLVVQATDSPRTYTVSGVAQPPDSSSFGPVSLFVSDADAVQLSMRHGAVDAVGVVPSADTDPGILADRIERDLPGTVAHSGDDRGAVEFLDAANARLMLVSLAGAMAVTALLVALLVVIGTLALSVQQRQRELALLRAIAATPRQIRALIGREVLVVGLLSGALGAAGGAPLAVLLRHRLVAAGTIPDALGLSVGPLPFVAGIAATACGAWCAAQLAAVRMARTAPTQAMHEAVTESRLAPVRLLLGAAVLAGGITLVIVLAGMHTAPASTPVTFVAVIVLCTGLALIGPVVARIAAQVAGWLLRPTGVSGHLATTHASGAATRIAGVVTPFTLLVAFGSTVLFSQTTLDHAARAQAHAGARADWVVTSSGSGVSDAAIKAMARMPEVRQIVALKHTAVRVGIGRYTAQGVTAGQWDDVWDPDVVEGSVRNFGDHDIAVSSVAADRLDVRPGERITITMGDGSTVRRMLVAVYERDLAFSDLTLSYSTVVRHVNTPLAEAVLVSGSGSGPSRDRLLSRLDGYFGLSVRRGEHPTHMVSGAERPDGAPGMLMLALVVIFTAIGGVNALASTVADRAGELRLLHRVGATDRQLVAMLQLETALVVVLASVLGGAVAAAVLCAFNMGMVGSGIPVIDPWGFLAMVGGVACASALAAGIPAWCLLRRQGPER